VEGCQRLASSPAQVLACARRWLKILLPQCAAKPNLRSEVSVCGLTPCLLGGLDSDSKGFEFPSLGADALGERIHLSLLVMADNGAPIFPAETKSVMRYQRKSNAKRVSWIFP
jgi:hypothetical protein